MLDAPFAPRQLGLGGGRKGGGLDVLRRLVVSVEVRRLDDGLLLRRLLIHYLMLATRVRVRVWWCVLRACCVRVR